MLTKTIDTPADTDNEPCPACGEGTLTLRFTGTVFVKTCSHCGADLGDNETSKFNLALRAALFPTGVT